MEPSELVCAGLKDACVDESSIIKFISKNFPLTYVNRDREVLINEIFKRAGRTRNNNLASFLHAIDDYVSTFPSGSQLYLLERPLTRKDRYYKKDQTASTTWSHGVKTINSLGIDGKFIDLLKPIGDTGKNAFETRGLSTTELDENTSSVVIHTLFRMVLFSHCWNGQPFLAHSFDKTPVLKVTNYSFAACPDVEHPRFVSSDVFLDQGFLPGKTSTDTFVHCTNVAEVFLTTLVSKIHSIACTVKIPSSALSNQTAYYLIESKYKGKPMYFAVRKLYYGNSSSCKLFSELIPPNLLKKGFQKFVPYTKDQRRLYTEENASHQKRTVQESFRRRISVVPFFSDFSSFSVRFAAVDVAFIVTGLTFAKTIRTYRAYAMEEVSNMFEVIAQAQKSGVGLVNELGVDLLKEMSPKNIKNFGYYLCAHLKKTHVSVFEVSAVILQALNLVFKESTAFIYAPYLVSIVLAGTPSVIPDQKVNQRIAKDFNSSYYKFKKYHFLKFSGNGFFPLELDPAYAPHFITRFETESIADARGKIPSSLEYLSL